MNSVFYRISHTLNKSDYFLLVIVCLTIQWSVEFKLRFWNQLSLLWNTAETKHVPCTSHDFAISYKYQ